MRKVKIEETACTSMRETGRFNQWVNQSTNQSVIESINHTINESSTL